MNVSLSGDREIVITRRFEAPRERVFDALIRPELVRRWLSGPAGWSLVLCRIDARPGGRYRYIWHGPDGAEMGMHGFFREVTVPERIVARETFDYGCEAQSGEQRVSMTLAEDGAGTVLTTAVCYPSKAARDAVLAGDMKNGLAAGYARLEDLLADPGEAEMRPGFERKRTDQGG